MSPNGYIYCRILAREKKKKKRKRRTASQSLWKRRSLMPTVLRAFLCIYWQYTSHDVRCG